MLESKKEILAKANRAIRDVLQLTRYHSYYANQENQYGEYALAVRTAGRIVDVTDAAIGRIEDIEKEAEETCKIFESITKGDGDDGKRNNGTDGGTDGGTDD